MPTLSPKDPDVAKTYAIDWQIQIVQEAHRSKDFIENEFVRPQRSTGFYYECTTAGRTARQWPIWPRAAGETVNDGSLVWTTRHPADASISSVQAAVWTLPAALTLESQTETGSITYVELSGGVDGVDYEVICHMTATDGREMEQTIVIPVRDQ